MAKLYTQEAESAAADDWVARGPAATSRLSEVEVASALARQTREGWLTELQRDQILALWRADFPWLRAVELTSGIAARAQDLLLRHPLRAAAAIQLASALHLRTALRAEVAFVAFDPRLGAAARREGLTLAL